MKLGLGVSLESLMEKGPNSLDQFLPLFFSFFLSLFFPLEIESSPVGGVGREGGCGESDLLRVEELQPEPIRGTFLT